MQARNSVNVYKFTSTRMHRVNKRLFNGTKVRMKELRLIDNVRRERKETSE